MLGLRYPRPSFEIADLKMAVNRVYPHDSFRLDISRISQKNGHLIFVVDCRYQQRSSKAKMQINNFKKCRFGTQSILIVVYLVCKQGRKLQQVHFQDLQSQSIIFRFVFHGHYIINLCFLRIEVHEMYH